MVETNTPPASPDEGIHESDYEAEEMELFEEDLEEVVDEAEEADDEDGNDIEGAYDDNAYDDEDIVVIASPERDDASLVFNKHEGAVFCCHIEPSSRVLAVTGGQDDTAYVWNMETGEVWLQCTDHTESVVACRFSHDGKYVATGDMGGVVQVWDVASRERVWQTAISEVSWLQWHHGTRVLMCGTVPGEVYLWKMPTGDCRIIANSGMKTEAGIFLPDGKRAAIGLDNGCVWILDLKAGTVLHRVEGTPEMGLITSLDAHADNNLLIAGTTSGKALLIKTQSGRMAGVLDCGRGNETSSVEAIGFCKTPGLAIVATGTVDGVLTLWDTARMVERVSTRQPMGISLLSWAADEPLLYTSGVDAVVRSYDGRSGQQVGEWTGCRSQINDMALSSDGSCLVVGSEDMSARVFRKSATHPDQQNAV